MNSQLQTAIDIKSHHSQFNPFILKIHANSTSHQQLQLSISAHILKKLSLINISEQRQLAELYKECLIDVIENPLIDFRSNQTISQIVHFLQYWQLCLHKAASWPHTRTCFYYLEDKLKKNKQFNMLDYVRLKRAQLQPNKKDFLSQIMAQAIYSQQLKSYIQQLKQQQQLKQISQERQSNSMSISQINPIFQSQQFIVSNKIIPQIYEQKQRIKLSQNILYTDTVQDWKQIQQRIIQLISLQKQNTKTINNNKQSVQLTIQLRQQLNDLIQSYVVQKLPILINQMKIRQLNKQNILKQLNFRKSIIQKLQIKQFTQIISLTISKLIYNQI